MDLISIIVPIYNVQSYLTTCLESIVNQSYTKLQIILVDDGSPDACPSICDEWGKKDTRISVIHKENGGLSDARNCGLKYINGEYVCFVDSDDILDRDFVLQLHDAMEKHGATIAACDVKDFYDNDKLTAEGQCGNHEVYTAEEGLRQIINGEGIRAIACNKMYKSELLNGESFVYGKHHEDEFFTYRIVDKAKKIVYLNSALYYYRQRTGSITASFSLKRIDALEAGLERLELLKDKYPSLYKEDKVNFCIACVSYQRYANDLPDSEIEKFEQTIKLLRSKIKFPFRELLLYSIREQAYIIGSKYPRIFSKLLNLIRGNRNEKLC